MRELVNAEALREPIDLITNDQPNVCPFDGARTDLLQVEDGFTIEECLECQRIFNFWNPEED